MPIISTKASECVITAYTSGKVVFQGEGARSYADITSACDDKIAEYFPQAGSDEVGTGDYFGPVVVCACLVNPADAFFCKNCK